MNHSQTPPTTGGGFPVVKYWAKQTLTPDGAKLWKTLMHKSACLSCAWGTGGQKGGFFNEEGDGLQRCMKSVEAIASELQPGIEESQFANRTLTELQQTSSQEANQLGRLNYPMIRRAGSNSYQRLTWEAVYQMVETAFLKPPERIASYSSGRSSNEAAYLLQLMLRALGSNNLADCSDLCHAPSTVGLKQVFGSGTSMVSLESLRQSDCVVLIGSNAPANHPRLMNELIEVRRRGGNVVVVNPQVEVGLVKFASPAYPLTSLLQGSEIASLYLQPIPGSDVAVFVAIQKAILESGAANLEFLRVHTEGWQTVVEMAQETDWQTLVDCCGIPQTELEQAARIIAKSQAVVFAWAMGITHHTNGVDNVWAIANTALLTGNAGKTGAGTMPIRGHSNVQGFGSMGVTVRLKEEIRLALEALLQKPLSRVPGYDTRALIEAADRGKIDTLICLGGNLYAANPDLEQAKRALSKIETIIYLATKPNLGHFHGLSHSNTLVIPVYARFENPHQTTVESGNNFVRLNEAGSTHLKTEGLVSEVDFLAEIAHRILGDAPIHWRRMQDTHYIRELIAKTIPGYKDISDLDQSKTEFTIPGRIFVEARFQTPSGKAQMQTTPLPTLFLPDRSHFSVPDNVPGLVVVLGTGRSYGQHNTVVYSATDRYRGMPHRNCILMNVEDVQSAGLHEHQRVTVKGEAGQLSDVEIIVGQIRRGAAFMFYPETNAIIKPQVDHRCGTPAYKRVPVMVFAAVPFDPSISSHSSKTVQNDKTLI
jgi:molybdopterin-dependent oxidoreductase alpha subunit